MSILSHPNVRVVPSPANQTAEQAVTALLLEYADVYGVPQMAADSLAVWPDDELLLLACLRAKLQDVVPTILADGAGGACPLSALGLVLLDWNSVARATLDGLYRLPAPWDVSRDDGRHPDTDEQADDAYAAACADDLLMRDAEPVGDAHFVPTFVG